MSQKCCHHLRLIGVTEGLLLGSKLSDTIQTERYSSYIYSVLTKSAPWKTLLISQ